MIRTFEGLIDEKSSVRLLEPILTDRPRRVLVTILDEEPDPSSINTALLSEQLLAADWNRPEEDEAWSHLQLGMCETEQLCSARASSRAAAITS